MTITAMPKSEDEEETPPRRRRRIVITVLVLLVLAATAAWFLVLKPNDGDTKPGTVMQLDEQTVNLAGGHYLKVQISLQLTKSAPTDLDGSKAQNDVIDLFSGQEVGEIDSGKVRQQLQQQLRQNLIHDYEGHVMDVYLTEFVTT